jgi:FKBP-type peptidyl-prolyl cis-trans isomerase
MTSSRAFFTLIGVLGLAVPACNEPIPGPSHPASESFAASLNVDIASMTKVAEDLYTKDLVVGTGNQAARGHTLRMRYTGWLKDGTRFDSNQTSGHSFLLGYGEVISGWDIGVIGMRVGGTRQLVIGSTYGYGATGSSPDIPGGATLVFVVELVSMQ